MPNPASSFGATGFIPESDGYMPGDSAYGNPVRQLGVLRSMDWRQFDQGAAAGPGPTVPIGGVILIAVGLALLEWRRIKAFGRRI